MSVFYTNSKALESSTHRGHFVSVGPPPEDGGHLHTVPLESKEVAQGHSFELWWQNHLLHYWPGLYCLCCHQVHSFKLDTDALKKRKLSCRILFPQHFICFFLFLFKCCWLALSADESVSLLLIMVKGSTEDNARKLPTVQQMLCNTGWYDRSNLGVF